MKISEHIRINDYAIELEEEKQPLLGSIYSLEPIELEILKTYIKTSLAKGFIQPCKFPAKESILFNLKVDRNFRFCVDY